MHQTHHIMAWHCTIDKNNVAIIIKTPSLVELIKIYVQIWNVLPNQT